MLTKADIQRLRALREKKHREAEGLFIVEGEKVVAELLAAGFPFAEIYATAAWSGQRTHEVTEAELARISHFPTPSSVLAVGRIERAPLAAGALDHGLTLALDGVQDPGNVGTLLRVADWFALDRVVLSPDCADLFSQKVINASMGSFARVRVHTADLATALAGVSAPVLGCDLTGEKVHTLPPLRDADQQVLDARQHLDRVDRLEQEVGDAQRDHAVHVLARARSGDADHRDVRADGGLADGREAVGASQDRHVDLEHDEIRGGLLERAQRDQAVVRLQHVDVDVAEQALDLANRAARILPLG